MYKVIRTTEDVIDTFIRIVFIIILLLGAYFIYDSWYVYQNANDTSMLRFKPESPEDIEKLKDLSGDVVGWITLDDTNIDYPIMQGETNDAYLNTDPYGDFALSGSIFLDSRNKPDFTDKYSLIYGHHMEHDYMFGGLDHFLEKDYFDKHRTGTLYTVAGDVYDFHVFSAAEAQTNVDALFAVNEVEGAAEWIEQHAYIFDKPSDEKWKEHIVGLSTCKTPDSIDRTLVFGYLTKKNQSTQPEQLEKYEKENLTSGGNTDERTENG